MCLTFMRISLIRRPINTLPFIADGIFDGVRLVRQQRILSASEIRVDIVKIITGFRPRALYSSFATLCQVAFNESSVASSASHRKAGGKVHFAVDVFIPSNYNNCRATCYQISNCLQIVIAEYPTPPPPTPPQLPLSVCLQLIVYGSRDGLSMKAT